MSKYTDWIESLTDKQVRALAYQAGLQGPMTFPVPTLRRRLLESDKAKAVYETSGIQNQS